MNTIAIGTVALGVLIIVLGLLLVTKRRSAAGIAISLFGLVIAVSPLVITFFLF
ncbi:MAG: hypothetical protein ACWGN2_12380 [Anaerolineales bacterium]